MTPSRLLHVACIALGLASGWRDDRIPPREPLVLGGFQVLAADFHTHSSLFSNGSFTPFGLVLAARHEGLDVIAITGHGNTLDGKVGRWFSTLIGGPMVIVGEEVQTLNTHLVAAGVERYISGRLPLRDQIAEVHRQGGVAIAAHPLRRFWAGFDDEAVATLDGTEVCHPDIYTMPAAKSDFERFAARAKKTAIGSSDYHGFGRIGGCRTYVFTRERSQVAVLEAVRHGRTVVYGAGGQAYGSPQLVALAENVPALREASTPFTTTTPFGLAASGAGSDHSP
jgi:predicted metal-dependent phosphoesterase TrpH